MKDKKSRRFSKGFGKEIGNSKDDFKINGSFSENKSRSRINERAIKEDSYNGGAGRKISDVFTTIYQRVKGQIFAESKDGFAILFDLISALIALIFARHHVAFGAYPLHIAFLSVLPEGVWISLVGAVIGSLSLGRRGIIQAVGAIVCVFIRTMISIYDESREDGAIFKEPLLLRISSAVIASFTVGLYTVLSDGFSFSNILYGGGGILLSMVFSFLLYGAFDGGVSLKSVFFSKSALFSRKRKDKERFSFLYFISSLLCYMFLISVALSAYDFFGVSPSYIFSSIVILFTAKRFGSLPAAAVAFVCTFAISASLAAGFVFLGLVSGVFFRVSIGYALFLGGGALALWSIYTSGVMGLVSTLPEYSASAFLMLPALKKLSREQQQNEITDEKCATDMVNSGAIAYINRKSSVAEMLEVSLASLSRALAVYNSAEEKIPLSEYRDLVIFEIEGFCKECEHYNKCKESSPAPCAERVEKISLALYEGERIVDAYDELLSEYCVNKYALISKISRSAASLMRLNWQGGVSDALAEEYMLFSKLVAEARESAEKEYSLNEDLTNALKPILAEFSLEHGCVKVIGKRRPRIIVAGEDVDGSIVTSEPLHSAIERASGFKLGAYEYYRRDRVALLECSARAAIRAECVSRQHRGGKEVSGDTASSFSTESERFYSLVSDGMGSGDIAGATSRFVSQFLSAILLLSINESSALHLLNHLIRQRREECSASIDLFELDLVSGEGTFFKCGAAPSYIKRADSVFRVRSDTAPIGLMKRIDAEKIRVQIKPSDYIIMLSDGISDTSEGEALLLEELSLVDGDMPPETVSERIIEAVRKKADPHDDITVLTVKVHGV